MNHDVTDGGALSRAEALSRIPLMPCAARGTLEPGPSTAADRASPRPAATPPAGTAVAPKTILGMQSISDVVFGLALSIGSVILISKLPRSPSDLVVDVLEFGFNFLIVIMIWIGYRRAVVTLPHETQATVIVNLALIFTVSIEPFLFWVMVSGGDMLEPASTAYALDVGSMMLLQATLNYLLLQEEKTAPRKGVEPLVLERVRRRMRSGAAVALLFFASALPIFWIPTPPDSTVRIDMWYAAIVLIVLVPRLSGRARGQQHV